VTTARSRSFALTRPSATSPTSSATTGERHAATARQSTTLDNIPGQGGPGTKSPDGRWEWDGQMWQPAPLPGAAQPLEPTAVAAQSVREYSSPPPSTAHSTAGGQQSVRASLAPDGRHYWDGSSWVSTISADGRWRWTGTAWEPLTTERRASGSRSFESPAARRTCVIVALGVACVGLLLGAIGDVVAIVIRSNATGRSLSSNEQLTIAAISGLPAILFLFGYVAAIVAVPMWSHRVYRNLPALGTQSLGFSPGKAAGGWFIRVRLR
jgi:hypothetical protein